MAECIKKQDPAVSCLQETNFSFKDTHRVKRWKKISHANGKQKKVGLAKTISDKTDFKPKIVTRDKERHYTMIKHSIPQECIALVHIYTSKTGISKYIKQILTDLKGEIGNNTIIIGDFNIPVSIR